MPIETVCPNPACAQRYTISSSVVGRSTRCRACRQTFVIGASTTSDETAPPTHVPPAPPVSQSDLSTVGRFVVRGKLGAGAFGTVYRAYDPNLNREVALKIPNPGAMDTPQRVERFLREAKAAAVLRHPHIVPVFDAGQDGDRYYIASAFIDGRPLAEAIEEGGTDFPRAARIVRELAEALAYAHDQGIVHRDVKPQNIMVDAHGHVHLMDFGLASRQDEVARLTADGAVMGTPAYMAPEQAAGQKGDAKPAADQYAAGVVLYELLTGHVPFTGPLPVVMHNVIHTEPDSPRKFRTYLPKDLETICLKAMAKHPEDRYPDCQALADDLRRWQEGEPITARRMGSIERISRWVKKEPKLAGAGAIIAIVFVVSFILITAFARRVNTARQQAETTLAQAEQDAAAARTADKRAAQTTLDEEQKKTKSLQAALDAERKTPQSIALQATLDEERKKVEALQADLAAEQKKVGLLRADLVAERKKLAALQTNPKMPGDNLVNGAKLIGKWTTIQENLGIEIVIEFAGNGTYTNSFNLNDMPFTRKGTYKLDIDKLSMHEGGKKVEGVYTVSKLTDDDMEWKGIGDVIMTLKRVKP